MIALKINPELTCDKVCHAIQKLLKSGNHNDDILVIEIKQIINTTDEMIPKLTHEIINE
jgi:ubiquitin-protein ligase